MRTISSDPELATRLRHVLARSARRLRQAAGSDLSPSQTAALAVIEREGPLTPSEVALRERIQRPSATRLLARLEDAGLITRAADPSDRRSALLTITPAGSALLAAARSRKDEFLSARLEALGAEDRATLERAAALLERMLEEPGA